MGRAACKYFLSRRINLTTPLVLQTGKGLFRSLVGNTDEPTKPRALLALRFLGRGEGDVDEQEIQIRQRQSPESHCPCCAEALDGAARGGAARA